MGILLVRFIHTRLWVEGTDDVDWQMHESVAAVAATGVSPVVRIPANEGWMVKRAFCSTRAYAGDSALMTV